MKWTIRISKAAVKMQLWHRPTSSCWESGKSRRTSVIALSDLKVGSNRGVLKQIRRVENVLCSLHKKVITRNMDNTEQRLRSLCHMKWPARKEWTWRPGVQFLFRKSRNHLRTAGVGTFALNKFHTESPKIFGAGIKSLVVQAAWRPGFVHPW